MNDIAVTERNTPAAVARLAELEAIIAAGKRTFYEVGRILREIRTRGSRSSRTAGPSYLRGPLQGD
jgi:hypothetical protein